VTGQKRKAKGQASKGDREQYSGRGEFNGRLRSRRICNPAVRRLDYKSSRSKLFQPDELLAGIRSKVASKSKDQGRDQSCPAVTEEALGQEIGEQARQEEVKDGLQLQSEKGKALGQAE
jgi:hypothetical protein